MNQLLSATSKALANSRPGLNSPIFGFRSFGGMAAFRGPRQDHIEKTLQEKLEPSHLQVTNESHGRKEDESHFHVLVVSSAFEEKKSLIEKHRLVQSFFTDQSGNLEFHSLRITAKTPAQWAKKNTVPDAPKCRGGDGLNKI